MMFRCGLRRAAGGLCLLWLAGCATVPSPDPVPAPAVDDAPVVVDATPAPAAASAPALPAPPPDPAVRQAALAASTKALREHDREARGGDGFHEDLWSRIRAGFAMPDLDDDLVRQWEQWYATRPDYVARMTERGSRYLFHIVEELEARGMPQELALLPFIESAFNPQAVSSARAAGMWQFIPSTGRAFDLKQNVFRDDRRDVLASTRAALDYLQSLHQMFDDWHLALVAYNWGQGSVRRAIARNKVSGSPTDYGSLRMPAETRHYVPKLQAVKNLIQRPQDFGLALPTLENHPYFLAVTIERDIDVALAARLAGMPLETFQQFNPQHDKPVILAAGTPQVLLPYDNANRFVRELALHEGPQASWTAWVAPRTLKPAEVARQVGMSEDELRAVNRIPPRMLVKVGSTLLVPRSAARQADVPEHLADNAAMVLAPEIAQRRLVIKAGAKGDSVAAVARRYRVSAQLVALWNDVAVDGRFRPGARIVVMVPTKKSVRSQRPAAPRRAKKR